MNVVDAAIASAETDERKRIVAWLRGHDHVCADILADKIEKGEHLKEKKDGQG